MAADVTDPATPQRLVDAAVDRFGGLDVLVANAGGPPPARALEVDDEPLQAALQANLLTSIRLVQAALPPMRAAGVGPHLPDHLQGGQGADPDPGPVQHRPDRPVGVGQDGRRRRSRRASPS